MKKLCVIPARHDSTRFPGKPLVQFAGKSLIRHVFDLVDSYRIFDLVVVATDHEKIADHCLKHGVPVTMTADDHPSGTDRVAEAVQNYPGYEIVVNVQGDEPMIEEELLRQMVDYLSKPHAAPIATAVAPLSTKDHDNPNRVKVVKNKESIAMYFSRSMIPFVRNANSEQRFWRHIGTYGFLRNDLLALVQLPISHLEKTEGLEQLRWLEHGRSIYCVEGDWKGFGIDTPQDGQEFVQLITPQ